MQNIGILWILTISFIKSDKNGCPLENFKIALFTKPELSATAKLVGMSFGTLPTDITSRSKYRPPYRYNNKTLNVLL